MPSFTLRNSMIRSMTAYSWKEVKYDWGNITWEICSVNHRYLEISIRLPEQFQNLYSALYKSVRSRITRGKVECSLHFKTNINEREEFIFNEQLAEYLINAANWVKKQSKEGEINPVDILRCPGVMKAKKKDLDITSTKILVTFNSVLDDFILAREVEGYSLKIMLEKRLKILSKEVKKIRSYMPDVLEWQRERLMNKINNSEIHIENNRLEQELILISQRIDISEELDRLEVHVKETYNILKRSDAVGRRLDFMMQEFNRESNTLSAKSINTNITKSAIEMKVLIEQMREQIQNIE